MVEAATRKKPESVERLSTRDRILSVAEEQFAQFGFHGISLRDILNQAGANSASGNYYFKSKHNLYLAAIEPSLEAVSNERDRLLTKLEASSGADTPALYDVIRAYVAPHFRYACSPGGQNYGRIMARLGYEPPELLAELMDTRLAPNRNRFSALLRRAIPEANDIALARGIAIVISIMATSAAHFPNHVPRVTRPKASEIVAVEGTTLAACTAAMLAVLGGERV